jgi:hypothetical protein
VYPLHWLQPVQRYQLIALICRHNGLQVDEGPERVLVLGWGPKCLMADLIKELDHGLSPLPAGSEVVFVNTHNPDDTLGAVLQNTTLEYIKVLHGGLVNGMMMRMGSDPWKLV